MAPTSRTSATEMIYVVTSLIVIWLAGLLVLAGQALNDIRLVLNNLTPDARYSDFASGFRLRLVSRIKPASLTDLGRQQQGRAIRHERIMFAWVIGGLILLVSYFFYVPA
jgi:hypothetical protein